MGGEEEVGMGRRGRNVDGEERKNGDGEEREKWGWGGEE